jgi:digeranylgeranylglycerophospholipid reductase
VNLKRPFGYSILRGGDENSIDTQLADQAMDSGVEVCLNSKFIKFDGMNSVMFKENGKIRTIRAKVVIGADGLNSRVAKLSGLAKEPVDRAIGFGYHFTDVEDVDSATVHGFLGHSIAPGEYGYIVPYQDEATVVTTLRPGMMTPGMNIKDYYNKFIKLPMVSRKIKNAKKMNIVSGAVSVNPLKSLVKDNIMLVGDAARLVDPLLGFGMKNAILSGKLAGEVSAQAVNNGCLTLKQLEKQLKGYQRTVQAAMFRDFKKRSNFRKIYESMNDCDMGELIKLLKELANSIDLDRTFETRKTNNIRFSALKILRSPYKIKLFLKYFLPAIRANYSIRA